MIHFDSSHLDAADRGRESLELVAIRLNSEDHSTVSPKQFDRTEWPGRAALQRDQWQVGLVPDSSLPELESIGYLDITFDPAVFAETFLDANYLPPAVWSRDSVDDRVQERVLDALDLELRALHDKQGIRNDLRELCGRELVEDDVDEPHQSFVQEITHDYRRQDLIVVAERFGMDAPHLKGKRELAAFVSDHDPADVYSALEAEATAEDDSTGASA